MLRSCNQLFSSLVIMAICLMGCASHFIPDQGTPNVDTYYFRSQDGWKLALTRYMPKYSFANSAPLLMIHDLYSNADSFASHRNQGLATCLARAGIMVFVLDFRGAGISEKPAWWNKRQYDWSFDDLVKYDLSASVLEALRISGRSQIDILGHGLGGMAVLAFAQTEYGKYIHNIILIGVPARWRELNALQRSLLQAANQLEPAKPIPAQMMHKISSPFVGAKETLFETMLANDKLLDRQTKDQFASSCLENISSTLALQVASWWKTNSFKSLDDKTDYLQGLSKIHSPMLIVSGKIDNLADPNESLELLDRVSSKDKTLRVFSKANGYSDNYGHLGLLIGPNANEDVFPFIYRWLKKHACSERKKIE